MRERAERIGAELSLSSALNAGTEMEVLVPGKIAYDLPVRPGPFGWLRRLYARGNGYVRGLEASTNG